MGAARRRQASSWPAAAGSRAFLTCLVAAAAAAAAAAAVAAGEAAATEAAAKASAAAAAAAATELAAADTIQRFPLHRLSFGSCFKQRQGWEATAAAASASSSAAASEADAKRETVFAVIQQLNPEAWLWIGDAGYSEGSDLASVRSALHAVESVSSYQALRERLLFLDGTWDDHDFGMNDGGKNQQNKEELQAAFLDFLRVPVDSPRRIRKGLYSSHLFPLPAPPQQQQQQQQQQEEGVRVLLLDTRSHRDSHFIPSLGMLSLSFPFSVVCSLGAAATRFLSHFLGLGYDYDGDILGEEQWAWLEAQLRHSKARVHLLVSSIQVLTGLPLVESWGHFPKARRRLLRLIDETQPRGLVLLSGDVHFTELLVILLLLLLQEGLVEFTSSGMTHSISESWLFKPVLLPLLRSIYTARLRPDSFSLSRNFGFVEFKYPNEQSGPIEVTLSSHSAETGELLLQETLEFRSNAVPRLQEEIPDVVRAPSPLLLLLPLLLLTAVLLLKLQPRFKGLLRLLRMHWRAAYRPLAGQQPLRSSSSCSSNSSDSSSSSNETAATATQSTTSPGGSPALRSRLPS
ncbi:hypothetical protein Efla_007282 [Eimeria flavescens]